MDSINHLSFNDIIIFPVSDPIYYARGQVDNKNVNPLLVITSKPESEPTPDDKGRVWLHCPEDRCDGVVILDKTRGKGGWGGRIQVVLLLTHSTGCDTTDTYKMVNQLK